MRQQVRRQIGETLVPASRVVTVVAVDLHRLLLPLGVYVLPQAGFAALATDVGRAAVDAAHRPILHRLPMAKQDVFYLQQPGQWSMRWPRLNLQGSTYSLQIGYFYLLLRGQTLQCFQLSDHLLHLGQQLADQPLIAGAETLGTDGVDVLQSALQDGPTTLLSRLSYLREADLYSLPLQVSPHALRSPPRETSPGLDDALLQLQSQNLFSALAQQPPPIPLQPVPQPTADIRLRYAEPGRQLLLTHKRSAPISRAPATPLLAGHLQEAEKDNQYPHCEGVISLNSQVELPLQMHLIPPVLPLHVHHSTHPPQCPAISRPRVRQPQFFQPLPGPDQPGHQQRDAPQRVQSPIDCLIPPLPPEGRTRRPYTPPYPYPPGQQANPGPVVKTTPPKQKPNCFAARQGYRPGALQVGPSCPAVPMPGHGRLTPLTSYSIRITHYRHHRRTRHPSLTALQRGTAQSQCQYPDHGQDMNAHAQSPVAFSPICGILHQPASCVLL